MSVNSLYSSADLLLIVVKNFAVVIVLPMRY